MRWARAAVSSGLDVVELEEEGLNEEIARRIRFIPSLRFTAVGRLLSR